MEKYILVHYSEIALKGKNREFFERKLMNNIKEALNCKVFRAYGRVFAKSNIEEKKTRERLSLLPGIANFSFCYKVGNDIKKIKEVALEIAKKSKEKSFKVETKKSVKFEYGSQKVNEIVGEEVLTKTNKKVNLSNPGFTIYIEITEKGSFIYRDKFLGVGGLPTGVSEKVVALISGGIDSPVASFLAMKRGCEIIALHFYNENLSKPDKIYEIIDVLKRIQPKIKLYVIPFGEIQKEIIAKVNSKYRMLIYRRIMNQIAEKIAKKEKAKAIVTGDSLGQVASQTLENMEVIDESTNLLVLRPLIGYNKEEIIQLAKKIGTYNISIKPYQDCCSFMVAKHPITKAKIEIVREIEKNIDNEKLIEKTLENANIS
jgi:thiamine biosynthesis protein ThiI